MEARILSLNSGMPESLEFEGRTLLTSIRRTAVPGPLVVHRDHIEGNAHGLPNVHGVEHSVLYAYELTSAQEFADRLGLGAYEPGFLGENVTLDALDEAEVSTGDVFEFGTVLAQAVLPRIPCSRVNFRTRNPEGQKTLQQCRGSGVYFRVLRAGEIHRDSKVRRVEKAEHRFSIAWLYRTMVAGTQLNAEEMRRALRNGAFPRKALDKWAAALEGKNS